MPWIKSAAGPRGQARFALGLATLLCACSAQAPAQCTEQGGGAVVVRWRVVDGQSGRLFPRGRCCCAPQSPQGPGRDQCLAAGGALGNDCPDSRAWLIPTVRLRVRRLPDGVEIPFDSECTAAELTTPFCLPEGDYQMDVTATAQRLDGTQAFSAAATEPEGRVVAPLGVTRTVRSGQIVNLDVVILSVNGSQPP